MTVQELDQMARKVATEAQPQLQAIADTAAQRHNITTIIFSQPDTIRLGMFLFEIQDQSFILGIQLGMKMIIDHMETHTNDGP